MRKKTHKEGHIMPMDLSCFLRLALTGFSPELLSEVVAAGVSAPFEQQSPIFKESIVR